MDINIVITLSIAGLVLAILFARVLFLIRKRRSALHAPRNKARMSRDALRDTVMLLERAIATARTPDGKSAVMAQVGSLADAFAQQQASPDLSLAQLLHVDDSLRADYPHGYWLLAGALMCEMAHCREVAQFIDTCRDPNDF